MGKYLLRHSQQDFINKYSSKYTIIDIMKLVGGSYKSIYYYLEKNNLNYKKCDFENVDKLEEIRELVKNKSLSDIALMFDLSNKMANDIINFYNISYKHGKNSSLNLELKKKIIKYAPGKKAADIALKFNVSITSVRRVCKEYNININIKEKVDTDEFVEKLKLIAPGNGSSYISKQLGITTNQVSYYCTKYGIEFDKKDSSHHDINFINQVVLYGEGKSIRNTAEFFGVSRTTIRNIFIRYDVDYIYEDIRKYDDLFLEDFRKKAVGKSFGEILEFFDGSVSSLAYVLDKYKVDYNDKFAFDINKLFLEELKKNAEGKLLREIASQYGVAISTIRRILIDYGIDYIGKREIPNSSVNESQIIPLEDIKNIFGVDDNTILVWIENGLKVNKTKRNNKKVVLFDRLESFLKNNLDLWSSVNLEMNFLGFAEKDWLKEKRRVDLLNKECGIDNKITEDVLEIIMLSQKGLLISEISKELDKSRDEVATCISENKDMVDMEYVSINRIAAICEVDLPIIEHCFKNKGLVIEDVGINNKKYVKCEEFINFIYTNDNLGVDMNSIDNIIVNDKGWSRVKGKVLKNEN